MEKNPTLKQKSYRFGKNHACFFQKLKKINKHKLFLESKNIFEENHVKRNSLECLFNIFPSSMKLTLVDGVCPDIRPVRYHTHRIYPSIHSLCIRLWISLSYQLVNIFLVSALRWLVVFADPSVPSLLHQFSSAFPIRIFATRSSLSSNSPRRRVRIAGGF